MMPLAQCSSYMAQAMAQGGQMLALGTGTAETRSLIRAMREQPSKVYAVWQEASALEARSHAHP